MVTRIPMSKTGHQKLRDELARLERKDRIEVMKAIETARGHGDLSENAEYHAAKERQSHIEGRILELKDKLSRAEVIDCTKVSDDRVVLGTVSANRPVFARIFLPGFPWPTCFCWSCRKQ